MTVLELPHSESRRIHVRTLSRKGMKSSLFSMDLAGAPVFTPYLLSFLAPAFFFLAFSAALASAAFLSSSALASAARCSGDLPSSSFSFLRAALASPAIHAPRQLSDLLMLMPSCSPTPSVLAVWVFSDPETAAGGGGQRDVKETTAWPDKKRAARAISEAKQPLRFGASSS